MNISGLNKDNVKILASMPQDKRMDYLFRLLDEYSEDELDKDLISKVISGSYPGNIYDVDGDLLGLDIISAYTQYNTIKMIDGVAKVRTCKECKKDIEISYSKLKRMKTMASKHNDLSMQCTCDKCKEAAANKKKKAKELKESMKKQIKEKSVVANKVEVKEIIKPDDILAAALMEINIVDVEPVKETPKPVKKVSKGIDKAPRRKVSIHSDIQPMQGNSLGALLQGIKI
jgi:hypothetical protein